MSHLVNLSGCMFQAMYLTAKHDSDPICQQLYTTLKEKNFFAISEFLTNMPINVDPDNKLFFNDLLDMTTVEGNNLMLYANLIVEYCFLDCDESKLDLNHHKKCLMGIVMDDIWSNGTNKNNLKNLRDIYHCIINSMINTMDIIMKHKLSTDNVTAINSISKLSDTFNDMIRQDLAVGKPHDKTMFADHVAQPKLRPTHDKLCVKNNESKDDLTDNDVSVSECLATDKIKHGPNHGPNHGPDNGPYMGSQRKYVFRPVFVLKTNRQKRKADTQPEADVGEYKKKHYDYM